MLDYIIRVGISLSVLLNTILGGYNNQTFSARNYAWKRVHRPNLVWFIDLLFWFDPDHCMGCWIYWYTRKHMEITYDNDLRAREMRMVQESQNIS